MTAASPKIRRADLECSLEFANSDNALDNDLNVQRALIIREPWISKILSGEKTWEMRSGPTSLRGWIGLAAQGRAEIVGLVRLVESRMPLSAANYDQYFGEHAIPPDQTAWAIENNWVFPWVLTDVIRLPKPVAFSQRAGAVKFVSLDRDIGGILAAFVHEPIVTVPAAVERPLPASPRPEPVSPVYVAPPRPSASTTRPTSFSSAQVDGPVFIYAPLKAHARGIPTGGKRLMVLKGSTAMRAGSATKRRDEDYRDGLVRQGVLAPSNDPALLVFARDHAFDSASRAAGVIKDGNASGPQQWMHPETRKTLRDYFDQGGRL